MKTKRVSPEQNGGDIVKKIQQIGEATYLDPRADEEIWEEIAERVRRKREKQERDTGRRKRFASCVLLACLTASELNRIYCPFLSDDIVLDLLRRPPVIETEKESLPYERLLEPDRSWTGVRDGSEEGRPNWVPGEVLVRMRDSSPPQEVRKTVEEILRKDVGGKREQGVDTQEIEVGRVEVVDDRLGVYLVNLGKEGREEKIAHILSSDPKVEYAEPNYIIELDEVASSGTTGGKTDPRRGEQWHLEAINAVSAWGVVKQSPRRAIAVVLDSGVDLTHPDLKERLWRNPREIQDNGVDDDGNGYVDDVWGWNAISGGDPLDDNGHGTHVAGIIAAEAFNGVDGVGVVGPLPVEIMAVKAFDKDGRGTVRGILEGLEYIRNEVERTNDTSFVVNMSWGSYSPSKAIEDSLHELYKQDVLLVASAGNDNVSVAPYPAGFPTVLAVGAVDRKEKKAWFSNYGPWVVLTSPGTEISSTLPMNCETLCQIGKAEREFGPLSGTSMAAPQVVGQIACLESVNPDLTREEIVQIVRQTARDIGEPGWDPVYGWGMPDVFKAVMVASGVLVSGKVVSKADQTPLSGIEVCASWGPGSFCDITDEEGRYKVFVPRQEIDEQIVFTAEGFWYQQARVAEWIDLGGNEELNFCLDPKKTGKLKGRVRVEGKEPGEELPVQVLQNDEITPVSFSTRSDGYFEVVLPLGRYTIAPSPTTPGIYLAQRKIEVPGEISWNLQGAPRIMVIDSEGHWYPPAANVAPTVLEALNRLGIGAAFYPIKQPNPRWPGCDLPTEKVLEGFNIVMDCSRLTSPEHLRYDDVLQKFLQKGGKVVVFSNDVYYWPWWLDKNVLRPWCRSSFSGDSPLEVPSCRLRSLVVKGEGIFTGLEFSIDPRVNPHPDVAGVVGKTGVERVLKADLGAGYCGRAMGVVGRGPGGGMMFTTSLNPEGTPPDVLDEMLRRILIQMTLPEVKIHSPESSVSAGDQFELTVEVVNPIRAPTGSLRVQVEVEGAKELRSDSLNCDGGKCEGIITIDPNSKGSFLVGGEVKKGVVGHIQPAVTIASLGEEVGIKKETNGTIPVKLSCNLLEGKPEGYFARVVASSPPVPDVENADIFFLREGGKTEERLLPFKFPFMGKKFDRYVLTPEGIKFPDDSEIRFQFPGDRKPDPSLPYVPQGAIWTQTMEGCLVVSYQHIPPANYAEGRADYTLKITKEGVISVQMSRQEGAFKGPVYILLSSGENEVKFSVPSGAEGENEGENRVLVITPPGPEVREEFSPTPLPPLPK